MAAPMVLGTNRKRCQRTFWLNKNQQQRAAYRNYTALQKSELRSSTIVAVGAEAGYNTRSTKVTIGAQAGYGAWSTKVAIGAERVNDKRSNIL